MAKVRKSNKNKSDEKLNKEAERDAEFDLIAKKLVDKPYNEPPKPPEELTEIPTSAPAEPDSLVQLSIYLPKGRLRQLRREAFDNKNGDFKWGHSNTSVTAIISAIVEDYYNK